MTYTDLAHDQENDAQGRELHDRRPAARPMMRDVLVTRTNGHGFQIEDGTWQNWSKFAAPADVRMPSVGDRVRVEFDRAGYIRGMQLLGVVPPVEPPAVAAPVAKPVAPAEVAPVFVGRIEQDARGIVVTRLAVLNTATAILGLGGGAATADEVIALAARLEAWATRG